MISSREQIVSDREIAIEAVRTADHPELHAVWPNGARVCIRPRSMAELREILARADASVTPAS